MTSRLAAEVLARINVGVFTVDAACRVITWNDFMAERSSVAATEVVGEVLFDAFPALPRKWFERKIRSVFTLGNYSFVSWRQRPYLFAFPHNRPITGGVEHMRQDCTLIPIRDDNGAITAVCITLVDATDASLLQQETETTAALLRDAVGELERLSERDALTGVHNRGSLDRRLVDEMARFTRYGTPLSILLFDLDHFKKVNDRFGHLGGDEVLRVVAARIGASLRHTDTFGRYGGEEFMVVMPSTTLSQGTEAAERMRKVVAGKPIPFGDQIIDVSVSIGVCEASPVVATVLSLIHHADVALYECKAAGRNCVRTHGAYALASVA